jgi:hypothetical protein
VVDLAGDARADVMVVRLIVEVGLKVVLAAFIQRPYSGLHAVAEGVVDVGRRRGVSWACSEAYRSPYFVSTTGVFVLSLDTA